MLPSIETSKSLQKIISLQKHVCSTASLRDNVFLKSQATILCRNFWYQVTHADDKNFFQSTEIHLELYYVLLILFKGIYATL